MDASAIAALLEQSSDSAEPFKMPNNDSSPTPSVIFGDEGRTPAGLTPQKDEINELISEKNFELEPDNEIPYQAKTQKLHTTKKAKDFELQDMLSLGPQ